VLVASDESAASGLAWATVWDDAVARDAFVAALRSALPRFPAPAALESREVAGRPVALLRVGWSGPVDVRLGGDGS
jgi:hypothetical protein